MGGLRIIRMCMGLPSGSVVVTTGGRVTVYVCLCNALTDRQVKQAAATPGFTKPGDIYAACGCRAQCGQCTRALLSLLRGEPGLAEPNGAN